ncbi:MAG: hypothetical protein ACYDBB_00725 [Armatimonadota bacterium]
MRTQALDTRHARVIIHLINPPAQETATESQAAIDELNRREKRRYEIKVAADKVKAAPNYSELDQLPPVVLYPEPQKDITVRFVPRALAGGPWKLTCALLLDADANSAAPLPVNVSDAYFWEMRVPEMKFWAVVVLDLERKEK